MSVEKQIQNIAIGKLTGCYGTAAVRAWTDNSVDEGLQQVIVRAELGEVSARDASGKAIAWKCKLDAAARTYTQDDKDTTKCDALYSAVFAIMEALTAGDFSSLSGAFCRGAMSEPSEYSMDERFNVRIASKTLMITTT